MNRVSPATASGVEGPGWNRTLGGAWSEVLRSLNLDKCGTVVEVGPGFSDKIAYGLAAIDFRGQIVLVDPTVSAGQWAHTRYGQILPSARTFVAPLSLADASLRFAGAEALVCNHIFDDMLLRLATPHALSASLFGRMRPGRPCAPEFVKTWRDVQAHPETLDRLIDEAALEFASGAARLAPAMVIVNQYPSWTHARQGLAFIHDAGLRVLDRVRELLEATGFVRATAVVPGEPVGATWLAMTRQAHAF